MLLDLYLQDLVLSVFFISIRILTQFFEFFLTTTTKRRRRPQRTSRGQRERAIDNDERPHRDEGPTGR